VVGDEGLLAEQRAFYRARAPEYDDWWQRRGPYDRGPEVAAEWERQVAVVASALDDVAPTGAVLELAAGTGWWTERLARRAGQLTVVDSSPEALGLNRRRVDRPDVDYVVADVFRWVSDRRYDLVFFSFWLSHVPRDCFSEFWALVGRCLAPGGRAFFVDNRHDPSSASPVADPFVLHYRPDEHLRQVSDGRRFRVVKVMYEPEELEAALGDLGWSARVEATGWFLYGRAEPPPGP
jgi:demethylmenaquinone methyltransferase/2-methoxy-6-polyprenyl-1,4-benzoquinol methylase